MNEHVRFTPPDVRFDPRVADELARWDPASLTVDSEAHPVVDPRSPFKGYVRMLTPQGGILVLYKDLNCGLLVAILRVLAGLSRTAMRCRCYRANVTNVMFGRYFAPTGRACRSGLAWIGRVFECLKN